MHDLKKIGDAVITSVKGYIANAIASIDKRIDTIDQRLAAVPAGKSAFEIAIACGFAGTEPEWIESLRGQAVKGDPGIDADWESISKAINVGIATAVAALPLPRDGQSVSLDDVQPLIAEQVKAAVGALPVPQNGKDVDPAEIARMVSEATAALPAPADGKSVAVEDVTPLITELVQHAVAALPAPENGKDADPDEIARIVAEAVAALPPAADGKSVTAEDVAPLVEAEVQRAVAALPVPINGKDADPDAIMQAVTEAVKALPPAKDGASVTVEQLRPVVLDAVKEAVAALPPPKDGKSISIDDIALILEGAQAKWALDFERRAADVLQRAVDRMPAAKDGRDAFDLDDIDLTQSGDGRTITLAFRRGDEVREKSFTLDVVLDRGVFRPDVEYVKGDAVTFGGSIWIAQKAAPGKPEAGDGWRLSVKRGRDGKDLTSGAAPAPRTPVRLA